MTTAMTTAQAGAFHPSTRLYRFTILIFISLLVLGSYFAYDSIGALENTLMVAPEDGYLCARCATRSRPISAWGRCSICGSERSTWHAVRLSGQTPR